MTQVKDGDADRRIGGMQQIRELGMRRKTSGELSQLNTRLLDGIVEGMNQTIGGDANSKQLIRQAIASDPDVKLLVNKAVSEASRVTKDYATQPIRTLNKPAALSRLKVTN